MVNFENKSSISEIENGKSGLYAETVSVLADVFQMTTDYILFGKEDSSFIIEGDNILRGIKTQKCKEAALEYLKDMQSHLIGYAEALMAIYRK